MIPNRAPLPRITNFTMIQYQESTVRAKAARIEQSTDAASKARPAQAPEAPPKRKPRKSRARPELHGKRRESATRSASHKAHWHPIIKAEVAKAFANGPLTVREFAAIRGVSDRTAGVKMNRWKEYGYVQRVGKVSRPIYPDLPNSRVMPFLLWDQVK